MNYTKGEWKVRSGFKVTCGDEQIWIADCYPFHEKHPRPKMIEAEANAHLIAAAPDMYEALKECQAGNGCHNDEEARLFDLVRNALAKAEGE